MSKLKSKSPSPPSKKRKSKLDIRKEKERVEKIWETAEPCFTAWKELMLSNNEEKVMRRREFVTRLQNERRALKSQFEKRIKKVVFEAFMKNWLEGVNDKRQSREEPSRLVYSRPSSSPVTLEMQRTQRAMDSQKSVNTYLEREASHSTVPRVFSATLAKVKPEMFHAEGAHKSHEEHLRRAVSAGFQLSSTPYRNLFRSQQGKSSTGFPEGSPFSTMRAASTGGLVDDTLSPNHSPLDSPLGTNGNSRLSPSPPLHSTTLDTLDVQASPRAPPRRRGRCKNASKSPRLKAGSLRRLVDPSAARPDLSSAPAICGNASAKGFASNDDFDIFEDLLISDQKKPEPLLDAMESQINTTQDKPDPATRTKEMQSSNSSTRKRSKSSLKPKMSTAQLCIDKPLHVLRQERKKTEQKPTCKTKPPDPITNSQAEKYGPYAPPGMETVEDPVLPSNLEIVAVDSGGEDDFDSKNVWYPWALPPCVGVASFQSANDNANPATGSNDEDGRPPQDQMILSPPPGFMPPPEDSEAEDKDDEEDQYSSDDYSDDSFLPESSAGNTRVNTAEEGQNPRCNQHGEQRGKEQAAQSQPVNFTTEEWTAEELRLIGAPPKLPKPVVYRLGRPPDQPTRLPKATSRPEMPTNPDDIHSKSIQSLDVVQTQMRATYKHPLPVTSPGNKYPLRYESGLTGLQKMKSGYGITQSVEERRKMMRAVLAMTQMQVQNLEGGNESEALSSSEDPASTSYSELHDINTIAKAAKQHHLGKVSNSRFPELASEQSSEVMLRNKERKANPKRFYQEQHRKKTLFYHQLFLGAKIVNYNKKKNAKAKKRKPTSLVGLASQGGAAVQSNLGVLDHSSLEAAPLS